jgi:hypothetical protein
MVWTRTQMNRKPEPQTTACGRAACVNGRETRMFGGKARIDVSKISTQTMAMREISIGQGGVNAAQMDSAPEFWWQESPFFFTSNYLQILPKVLYCPRRELISFGILPSF